MSVVTAEVTGMRKFVLIGAAMLVGSAATAAAQYTTLTIFNRFPNAQWVCNGFEDHHRILPGSHGSIILFVDTPATQTTDRRVCLLVEPDNTVVNVQMQPAGRK